MRWMWVVAAALATATPASAQEGDALQSYGPLRFGMTIAEARADGQPTTGKRVRVALRFNVH